MGDDRREPPHEREGELVRAEAEYPPSEQARFQILLQVGVEPGSAVVTALDPWNRRSRRAQ
jgi:hypothetical protein